MSDLNDVKLFGRVVKDAELRVTANGMKIAGFSIAVNRTRKDKDGNFVQEGNFFPLSLYGDYAEKMLPHLTKGQKLIVEGFLKQDRWQTQDGKNRSATSVGVSRIHLIFDSKKDSQNQAEEGNSTDGLDFTDEQMQKMYENEPSEDDVFIEPSVQEEGIY